MTLLWWTLFLSLSPYGSFSPGQAKCVFFFIHCDQTLESKNTFVLVLKNCWFFKRIRFLPNAICNKKCAMCNKIGQQTYFLKEQLRKREKIKPFSHSEASKKIWHILLICPVLGKWPMYVILWWSLWCLLVTINSPGTGALRPGRYFKPLDKRHPNIWNETRPTKVKDCRRNSD